MKTQIVPISELKENPDNPRRINESDFGKSAESIQDFSGTLRMWMTEASAE